MSSQENKYRQKWINKLKYKIKCLLNCSGITFGSRFGFGQTSVLHQLKGKVHIVHLEQKQLEKIYEQFECQRKTFRRYARFSLFEY